MKKISVLINKTALELTYLSQDSLEYVYNYIDYKLSPYRTLGFFAYNTYEKDHNLIDGQTTPGLFSKTLKKYIVQNPVCLELPALQHINFFNPETQRFYISSNEYPKLIHASAYYCFIYTTLHK